ncbi:phosphoribosyltransferase [Halomonas sp. HP20-15]|uniref:phosphoribosyltransferase n=1 Tax=Halomonas sp. HP20-15 TaxID=3085901 RepID=UPI0029812D95|nr:phosphoribosyltransferase [Halomonas sp. HP20-15]MDW5377879.1 phosphoribosyltransferase [Halomonas sp. HP20-15]
MTDLPFQDDRTELPFHDRRDAGERLAARLLQRAYRNPLIVGLPRGGVPVAARIALALKAPLEVLIVRKLGVPGHEEFAMGALASGDVSVLDEQLIRRLAIDAHALQRVIDRERGELRRREARFRGERPYPSLAGRDVILVDDGIATGSTMRAALRAVRKLGAERCILAVPVAPADSLASLRSEADETLCLATPEPFNAVGQWYRRFDQTEDAEVRACLAEQAYPETQH